MKFDRDTEREHKKVHVSATREARENKAKTTQVRSWYCNLTKLTCNLTATYATT